MFRGFDVKEARNFEEVILQFQPKLSNAYRGTSPRKLIPGTRVSLPFAPEASFVGTDNFTE